MNDCEACHGVGEYERSGATCRQCNGTGKISDEELERRAERKRRRDAYLLFERDLKKMADHVRVAMLLGPGSFSGRAKARTEQQRKEASDLALSVVRELVNAWV